MSTQLGSYSCLVFFTAPGYGIYDVNPRELETMDDVIKLINEYFGVLVESEVPNKTNFQVS